MLVSDARDVRTRCGVILPGPLVGALPKRLPVVSFDSGEAGLTRVPSRLESLAFCFCRGFPWIRRAPGALDGRRVRWPQTRDTRRLWRRRRL